MKMKYFGLFAALLSTVALSAGDIDLGKHIRKYWTTYNEKTIPGDGGKTWTPEKCAFRVQYLKAALERFAPHILAETWEADRIFNWKKGTYLTILQFGTKKEKVSTPQKNPAHECTSWVTMPDLTGGKEIIMHKNRDSSRKALALMRRAVPGKHAWIGSGAANTLFPAQGINDNGLVVLVNSGDKVADAHNSRYGLGTVMICRILLEECATADEALELLEKIIHDKAYSHGKAGSIWLIGDADKVYIAENHARQIEYKEVKSGFAIRANAFHYPEMQKYSLLNSKNFLNQRRREFAVRDYLVNTQWRKNGVITAADYAAASRIDKMDGAGYTPCGNSTISGSTFVIDKEFPDFLSTAHLVISWPKTSCYLPVPLTVQEIPEVLLDGSFSMRSFELKDKKLPLLEPDKLAALEASMRARHAQAVEKSRLVLRCESDITARENAAKILNDAFTENCKAMFDAVK